MRTTELAEVEALLERVLPDPMGFAQRLLQQVVTQWAEVAPAASGMPDDYEPTVTMFHDPGPDESRPNITVLLAPALGACDCWGLQPDCTMCNGEGSAGWSQPDSELFQEYVGPAVDRLKACATPDAGHGAGAQSDRDQAAKEPPEGEE